MKQALQNEKLKGDKFQFLMQDEKLMVFFDGSTKGVGRAGFSVEGGDMIDSKKDVPVDGQNRKSSTVNISKQMVERAQRDDITQTITKIENNIEIRSHTPTTSLPTPPIVNSSSTASTSLKYTI